MSWKPREPGTKESERRTRPDAAALAAMGLDHTPGFNCGACGEPVDKHGDPDCVAALNNALKAGVKIELGSLSQEEAQALAETLYDIWEEIWEQQGSKRDLMASWVDAMDRWGLLAEPEE